MINLRKYGREPFDIAVIHGGPGAPGEVAPVAKELASIRGALEPLQTANTCEGQVLELKNVLEENATLPVILIGHSWGAMLSYILTARYPSLVKKLIMVASGVFEDKYAEQIDAARLSKLSESERVEEISLVEALNNPETKDKDRLMARWGELMSRADSYAPLPGNAEVQKGLEVNYDINKNVWEGAKKLRTSGELLEMGKQIICPVVAIHGDYDSHSAEGVREPLSRVVKDFRFILLEKCGHYPWRERYARDRFYDILKSEIQ